MKGTFHNDVNRGHSRKRRSLCNSSENRTVCVTLAFSYGGHHGSSEVVHPASCLEERHAGYICHPDDGDSEKREKDSGQSPKEWTANLVRVYFFE